MDNKNHAEAKKDFKLSGIKFKILSTEEAGGEGIIEAYVSIFNNVDLVGDIIQQGAFAESLMKKLPKGVWSHDWQAPIALTLEAREDAKGLYIKGQFILTVQKAQEAYDLIKAGVIDEFSIGFRVLDDEWKEDGTRVITKARLYEWSPVLVGANPDTELISVKSGEDAEEETEEEVIEPIPPVEEVIPVVAEEVVKEVVEEEKAIEKVKHDLEKGVVILSFTVKGETITEEIKMSDNFIKYLREKKALKKKVDTNNGEGDATRKILRIRQVALQQKSSAEYVLRITNKK